MTREEREDAINCFKNKIENEVYGSKYNKLALEALEQEPCEDAVSRQQAIEFVNEVIGGKNELADAIRDGVEAVLSALPSVIPIRPKGHWYIDERPESNREVICSNCEQPIFRYHELYFDYRPKYCPNCGADMGEVEE